MNAFRKWIMVWLLILMVITVLSVLLGSRIEAIQEAWSSFYLGEESFSSMVIAQRIPRTLFGLLAGASLAVSGCLMQAITRNPIADPGILGVNTGASLAVVCGIAFFSISTLPQYLLFAFVGGILTAVFVYGIACFKEASSSGIKLALAGTATSLALSSFVSAILLPNAVIMDTFRFWQIGSIARADWSSVFLILPCILLGVSIAFLLASSLNTMALGDTLASSLGLSVSRIRMLAACSGVLLCAAVTALAGPIGFVGLMVPHIIRMLGYHDLRYQLPLCVIGGGIILLTADIIGRVLGSPSELETGIVCALLGAPIFIHIVRQGKKERS